MPDIAVKNLAGEQVDTISLRDDVFAAKPNDVLVHQAVTRLLAGQRRGTHKAKSRGEVRGSTVKPWRQKGTGRARQGSRKSPIWTGGGVAFPPVPRSYVVRMPKKMRRQAARAAISSRVADNAVVVVSSLEPSEPKTRVFAAALQALRASGKVLIVGDSVSETTTRAARNLPHVHLKPASTLNVLDVLGHDVLVFSVDGIRRLERALSDADV